ncbi:MAG: D-alanyl-lipoteichoic acid biosynthesis protein DltB [Oscillospiraceae bacterium]|jgi:membrane protein involved in D-alanine export|nr:D-alanyl-lipoteichoic acid biosynthesis protein DltB [Oscillospiraceae bacterium]
MIPFDGIKFFYVLSALLLPAAVLGFFQKPRKYYGMFATLVMLALIFGTAAQRVTLLLFYLLQLFLALAYSKLRKKSDKRYLLWIFLVLSAAPLIVVKLGGVIEGLSFIHLMGISYMTFRALQVLIETYDGLIGEVDALDFSYFLLFFPSVSSGPIDRYRRFKADADKVYERAEFAELVKKGVWKLLWGAFFNFGVSSVIYSGWLMPLPGEGLWNTVLYMYGYTFFLFFNFAGYSLMAIGASYILGIRTPENFNLPFLSRDMKDFWSRWHMSLSGWMRDYVYTRFVMASMKGGWFKDKRTGSYIGYVITMLTMGIWHGITPAYIVYGAYHGILMCVNDLLDTRWKHYKSLKKNKVFEAFSVIITFHLFSFGLLIFSGRIV